MKLFLDTSVLLAAAGSATGASRAVVELSARNGWTLITSRYCVAEAQANLPKLQTAAAAVWQRHILSVLTVVDDSLVYDKPLTFTKAKDKPVLITALACGCNHLLTLDRKDFGPFMGRPLYKLLIGLPASFLELMREEGRLVE